MADQSPPEDVQSANPEGTQADDTVSSGQPEPVELPTKLRVHALAKILGVTSKALLVSLRELGIEARSAQSSLSREVAESVRDSLIAPHTGTPTSDSAEVAPSLGVSPSARDAQSPEPSESADELAPSVPTAESPWFTNAPSEEPESVQPKATTFATPLFLQPAPSPTAGETVEHSSAQPSPRRRRSRKTTPKAEAVDTASPGSPSQVDLQSVEGATADADNARARTATDASTPDDSESTAESDTDSSTRNPGTTAAENNDDHTADDHTADESDEQSQPRRRRRGRRGRGRGRGEQFLDENGSDDNSTDDDNGGDDNQVTDDNGTDRRVSATESDDDSDKVASTDSDPSEDNDPGGSESDESAEGDDQQTGAGRRSRRSRTRSRQGSDKPGDSDSGEPVTDEVDGTSAGGGADEAESNSRDSDDDSSSGDADADGSSRRRRRRRRRKTGADAAAEGASSEDDPPNTVVHEREPRNKNRTPRDEVQGITGSTRLEAKRQRRRDGRDAGRRRPPILTESEFLARRESVDRVMVVREKATPDHPLTTQVAVLEDGVLVEHFVTSSATASMVGNVYLGRVQNVLPSMEAAFIDIGRGRNGVLYAGEVNWDAAGLGGNSRKIEQALKPGDQILVQVSKDPVGHKGARLTTQLSLAGRFLVYVPGGSSTGISRKLPDTERKRLKEILRDIVPPEAGVIIRTAAEGVSEDELARDVTRLQAQWASIEERSANAETGKGVQPQALYEEPDMLVKVIRDLFNEDFSKLVIEGEKAWTTTSTYVETVAPDMMDRLHRYEADGGSVDVFAAHRIDEQLAKALDRKVWLPSGGTLVIDRTEAMTVVDVNTGKFTGSGGNLEETVTRNNIEAAEEVVRQMRLRDIGGMIVVDFIDMVLESNRDLVLRRLTESLGRDRTRHQVSEVTSLGLVQMTRKKLGTGLVEAFSTTCEHCQGRGIVVHPFPIDAKPDNDGGRSSSPRSESSGSSNGRRRRGRDNKPDGDRSESNERGSSGGSPASRDQSESTAVDPSVKRAHPVALAMAAHHDEVVADVSPAVVEAGAPGENRDKDSGVTVVSATDVDHADVDHDDVDHADVDHAGVDSGTSAVDPTPVQDAGAEDAATEPVVVKARRGRRVARKAAAPSGPSSETGAVIVVPAAVDGVDAGTATDGAVTDRADAGSGHDRQPLTAAAEQSADASVGDVPTARPRRRRAAARPAGPPVDM